MALACVAAGLARTRRWSRTPAVLTQLFVGIVGIYLVQGHRYDWGVPGMALAAAGFAAAARPAQPARAGRRSGRRADRRRDPDGPPLGRRLVVGGQALTELGERPGQQPGHVHLRDAELAGDLRLGHVPEEPQQQDPLLPRRAAVPAMA